MLFFTAPPTIVYVCFLLENDVNITPCGPSFWPHTLELGLPALAWMQRLPFGLVPSQASSLKPFPRTTTTCCLCVRATDVATTTSAATRAAATSKPSHLRVTAQH